MVGTLARVASAKEAADYYIQSQASHRPPDNYYLCGEEPDGVWWNPHGLFGLEDGARVDANAFYQLHQGFAPFNPYDPNDLGEKTKLTRNAGSENRTAAFDLTFSADKSVSTLWAMTDGHVHDELARAHDDAVRTALDLIVGKYCAKTRDRPTGEPLRTIDAKIMAATFQHQSSRENDPQLHTHSVIFNLALADDGKWRSLQGKPLYDWQKTAGAVYRNALAWNISQRLGLAVERYGRNGEMSRIVNIPQDLQDFWSKRRKAIVAAAKGMGISTADSAARAEQLNKNTRRPKQQGELRSERAVRWEFEAGRYVQDIQAALDAVPRHQIADEDMEELRELLQRIPDDLTETEAIFRVNHLFQRIANVLPGLMPPEQIEAVASQILERADVLELDRWGEGADVKADLPHTRVFTTKKQLDRERDIERIAHSLAVQPAEDIPTELVDKHLDMLAEKGMPLSAEQARAVRIATTGQRNVIIEGAAGSGKTTTLAPITDIARKAGWTVYGTGQAWRTANELAAATHIPSWCLMTLLNKYRKGQLDLDEKSLIIVDEAGQLRVSHAARLLEIAEKTGARIIWAGDTRQQQPIGAGPGLRLLQSAVGSVLVTQIRRQRADAEDVLVHTEGLTPAEARDRLATMNHTEQQEIVRQHRADNEAPRFVPWQITASSNLRDGFVDDRNEAKESVAKAIAAYRDRDRFHLGPHLEATLLQLVEDWDRHRQEAPDQSTLVIARTHDEIGALTPFLRERALTKEQRAGEVTVTVAGGNSENRHKQPRKILVAPGERLVIRTPCRDLGLDTGNLLTVERIETPTDRHGEPIKNKRGEARHIITARRDDGKIYTFDPEEIRDWSADRGLHGLPRLDYGYALTFSSAQGATVDHTYVLADDRPALETIYPSLTRHRDRLDVYVNAEPIRLTVAEERPEYDHQRDVTDEDILDHLARVWSRSDPKQAARDYILPPEERATALEPLPPPDPEDTTPRDPAGSTNAWPAPVLPAACQPSTGFASIVPRTAKLPSSNSSSAQPARTPSIATTPTPTSSWPKTIEAIKESYRAVTERERLTEPVEALRDPTYLETLRTHRSLLDRAREALRRIIKLPEHFRAADRAGITREGLVDWIHDYAERQREFNAAACYPAPIQNRTPQRPPSPVALHRRHGAAPQHASPACSGLARRGRPYLGSCRETHHSETSQRTFNSILESQRTAFRYDRQRDTSSGSSAKPTKTRKLSSPPARDPTTPPSTGPASVTQGRPAEGYRPSPACRRVRSLPGPLRRASEQRSRRRDDGPPQPQPAGRNPATDRGPGRGALPAHHRNRRTARQSTPDHAGRRARGPPRQRRPRRSARDRPETRPGRQLRIGRLRFRTRTTWNKFRVHREPRRRHVRRDLHHRPAPGRTRRPAPPGLSFVCATRPNTCATRPSPTGTSALPA